jgi:uncharacterized protein (DUF1810 family)
MSETYNLSRFTSAQNPVFEQVCSELRAGRKMGHWMWFIFPQIKGLGECQMSQAFAISCREEAAAYLNHEILGPRLIECTKIVNGLDGLDAREIFGYIDAMKFRSSMTLFTQVATGEQPFSAALQKYFGGAPDPLTLERL